MKILFLFLFAVTSIVATSRHQYGKCSIVINELSVKKQNQFLELAKLCPDEETNVYAKLGGHVLLVIDLNTKKLEKMFWLHERMLIPSVSPEIITSAQDGDISAPSTSKSTPVADPSGGVVVKSTGSSRSTTTVPDTTPGRNLGQTAVYTNAGTLGSSANVRSTSARKEPGSTQSRDSSIEERKPAVGTTPNFSDRTMDRPTIKKPMVTYDQNGRNTNSRNPWASQNRNNSASSECYRNPYCQSSKNRKKRDLVSVQQNAHYFYVVEMKLSYNKDHTYGFFLLKLEDKEVKTKTLVKKIFTENSIMDDAAVSKTASKAIDCVVISWKHDDHTDLADILLPVNAQSRPYKVAELDDSDSTISKCDNSLFGMQEDSFQTTSPTKGAPNSCERDPSLEDRDDMEEESNDIGVNQMPLLPFKFKGKKLLRQAKELIVNTWHNLGQPREPEFFNQKPVEITAALLNLGKSTVEDVIRQFKRGEAFSNSIKRNRVCPVTDIDGPEKIMLYQIITSYYKNNKFPKAEEMRNEFIKRVREHRKNSMVPEVAIESSSDKSSSVVSPLDEVAIAQGSIEGVPESRTAAANVPTEDCVDNEYKCCAKSFAKILSKNGYRYGRLNLKDTAVHAPYVIQNRRKYLKRIEELQKDPNVEFIYQDETWIDPHQRPAYGWRQKKKLQTFQSRADFQPSKHKSSRGGRIVVLGAGSKERGFISCANLVYKVSKAKSKTDDYHDNVNQVVFTRWMKKLVRCLKDEPGNKKFVIIMDNCPFHTVLDAPTSSKNRPDFVSWLRKMELAGTPGIPANYEKLTRPELWNIVKTIKAQVCPYKLDHILEGTNYEIIRLPQYSPELNPIEYVWKDIKTYVREKNTNQNINEAVTLAKDYMAAYTKEKWLPYVNHVHNVEEIYRVGDAEYESFVLQNPQINELHLALEEDEENDTFEFIDDYDLEEEMLVRDTSF